jgi:hypothetical protein
MLPDNDCVDFRIAEGLYNAGYRKIDSVTFVGGIVEQLRAEVAEEIFADFRAEMRSEIARNKELFAEDEDDFYEGRNDAYRTAINCLAELKKKYTEGGE